MSRPAVSAISFLNAAPLLWDFAHGPLRRAYDVNYSVPSACAEALRAGTADLATIPAVAYHTIPGLRIVPDVCVGTSGAVRSILLVSKVPIDDIRTVAADTSSRTSVALLRVLFRAWHGGPRQFTAMEPDLRLMLDQHDAALVIGDRAFALEGAPYYIYDLGEEWVKRTSHPFVFAFWAVREEAAAKLPDSAELISQLRDSRDHGLAHLDRIIAEWAHRVPLTRSEIRSYLTRNLDFTLDDAHLSGMRLFLHLAVKHGVLAETRPLEFLGDVRTAALANGTQG
jgi:chorismate dehydratase